MNRSGLRQKRSMGKESPLSKRPKLDFTIKTRESLKDDKEKVRESPRRRNGSKPAEDNSFENKKSCDLPTASDWDDDFSGDMLERVCLIADLSQAMVNNQSTPKSVERNKVGSETFDKNKVQNKPKVSTLNLDRGNANEELEKLRLEFEKLQEKFKTKEGEVHILRSQLKQNEDAKQAAALQNIKVMEEIKKKYNEKITTAEKELETTKTKLQFKDMEFKNLSERCRQLEYNISKSKTGESHLDGTKNWTSSQATQKFQAKEALDHEHCPSARGPNEEDPLFDFSLPATHEGRTLAYMVCPEFFTFAEEPNIVPLYNFRSVHKVDFNKKEKYIWSDLPKQNHFIKSLYDSVSGLFTRENFGQKELEETIEEVLETCGRILTHSKEVLLFLEKLQMQNSENDDSDQSLLDNEEEVVGITVKMLLDGKRLNKEECAIEGRRALALIYSLMKSSKVISQLVKSNTDFMNLLKDIAAAVGNLRRPLRYTGLLAGITFILQLVVGEKDLEKEVLTLINEIVEEVIFARPKLDVLKEVVNVLAAGKHHLEFLSGLCRKASVESCALYMDSKLKQAMFFTKNACPLKLLCMQVMGLACLPSSQSIRGEVTKRFIGWLNDAIDTPHRKAVKWLPTNSLSVQEDRCFDVTECLLYLLTLCVKDYNLGFPPSGGGSMPDLEEKRNNLISIIGSGAVLLKRILKADQRQLHNTYSLRFAVLLKGLVPSKSDFCGTNRMSRMSSVQVEAITWITDLLESDLRNQDCNLRQNAVLPEGDVFSALKINDESTIY